ncbi:response regulator [Trichlorobacter ammonificans]|uniref:DNA-binding response regulator n=1 Tax=Trichlorobacter ammonificans TaxID=2916410 RepID=A0ABM9D8W0_9BACT|nr:response regulator transcription factor [Trichlorobacter ammonificans]CAH2030804.1 DNA-binding response regulator [Trichlorobacter ammonificans]
MRLAIVEDNAITLEALQQTLLAEPDVAAVDGFGSAEEALRTLDLLRPDILLVDLGLPGMQGAELIERVKELCPATEIMVYTIFDDSPTVFAAIKAGASGFILKDATPKELIASLRTLLQGGAPMSPRIARKVIHEFRNGSAVPEQPLLSPREEKVIRCIAEGLSYNDVAERLGISYHTVHTHIKKAYEKLQVRGRRQALQRAYELGIL